MIKTSTMINGLEDDNCGMQGAIGVDGLGLILSRLVDLVASHRSGSGRLPGRRGLCFSDVHRSVMFSRIGLYSGEISTA
jgi:hypothetical protein